MILLWHFLELYYQGGWELDESMEEAADRETFEEAGVLGEIGVSIFLNISFVLFFFNSIQLSWIFS